MYYTILYHTIPSIYDSTILHYSILYYTMLGGPAWAVEPAAPLDGVAAEPPLRGLGG